MIFVGNYQTWYIFVYDIRSCLLIMDDDRNPDNSTRERVSTEMKGEVYYYIESR